MILLCNLRQAMEGRAKARCNAMKAEAGTPEQPDKRFWGFLEKNFALKNKMRRKKKSWHDFCYMLSERKKLKSFQKN